MNFAHSRHLFSLLTKQSVFYFHLQIYAVFLGFNMYFLDKLNDFRRNSAILNLFARLT